MMATPVDAFISGRQARQQYDYGQTRNALAQMELDNAPQAMAQRNQLAQLQTEGAQMDIDQARAKEGYTRLAQALSSPDPKAYVLQNEPDLARALQGQGVDLTTLDDESAKGILGAFAQHYAGKAGIAPTPQFKTIGDVNNPTNGLLQQNPTTGELKQVVAPVKPEKASFGHVVLSNGNVGAFDQNTGQVRDTGVKAQQTTSTQTGTPDAVESAAKAISNYQQAPMSAYAMRSPYGQAVMARVMELNPDYQANEFGSRSKAYKDFASGKLGQQVASFNRSFAHLDTLSQLGEAMQNGDVQAINKIGNAFARQTGKAAPASFDAAKKVVADEIVKAIVGAGGGVADREEAASTINNASSPAQLAGVIDTYKELIGGQLFSLQQQYEQSTGRKDFDRLLNKEVIAYRDAHPMGGAPKPAPAQQAPAQGQPVRVNTPQEAMALTPGTVFITPDGRRKVR